MDRFTNLWRYPQTLKQLQLNAWVSRAPALGSRTADVLYQVATAIPEQIRALLRLGRSVLAAIALAAVGASAAPPDVVLLDDFDDGILDPAWRISIEGNAVDWMARESGTNLTADDIQPVAAYCASGGGCNEWGRVFLSQSVKAVTNFVADFDFSWDSDGLPSAQQRIGVQLVGTDGTTFADIQLRDSWLCCTGGMRANIGDSRHNEPWNSQPLMGRARIKVVRHGDVVSVFWNDDPDPLVSGEFALPLHEVRIHFGRFSQNPSGPSCGDACNSAGRSTFGSLSVDRIRVEGILACNGTESISKTKCRVKRDGTTRLAVKLEGGFDGDTYEVELSTGESQHGVLNRKGKARAKFTDLPQGAGAATATWGCGAEAQLDYDCS